MAPYDETRVMTHVYQISENIPRTGIMLSELRERLETYLSRNRASPSIEQGGGISYKLRNGLDVTIADECGCHLELMVKGEEGKIKRSIAILKKIYQGNIELSFCR